MLLSPSHGLTTNKTNKDEDMEDVPEDVPELLPASAPERTDTSQSEEVPKAESKEEASAPKGRRRGRRQVMKKTTIKDAEGYLGPYLFFVSSIFHFPKTLSQQLTNPPSFLIAQSRKKNLSGNRFPRTKRHHL